MQIKTAFTIITRAVSQAQKKCTLVLHY